MNRDDYSAFVKKKNPKPARTNNGTPPTAAAPCWDQRAGPLRAPGTLQEGSGTDPPRYPSHKNRFGAAAGARAPPLNRIDIGHRTRTRTRTRSPSRTRTAAKAL